VAEFDDLLQLEWGDVVDKAAVHSDSVESYKDILAFGLAFVMAMERSAISELHSRRVMNELFRIWAESTKP
jgi:hypothetical protein